MTGTPSDAEARTESILREGEDKRVAAVLEVVRGLEGQVANLKIAQASNRRIGMAVGIVMGQLKADDDVALAAMKRASMNSNRKLGEVADDVIYAGGLET